MAKNSNRVVISALGHFHPPNLIDNNFFTELDIGSDAAWIIERVGIESRRSVLTREQLLALRRGDVTIEQLKADGGFTSIAKMSVEAWKHLRSRLDAQAATQPEVIICGTSVPDYDIPANASTIGNEIGVEAVCFDVNSACSSFVVDVHVASSMLKSGASKQVAVFNPERYSIRLNYTDRASCVLFGDGCSAALLSSDADKGLEVVDTYIESMPSKFDMIQIPDGGHFYQNGQAVQKFAITRTMDVTLKILERNGLKTTDVNYFVGHQANLRMITSAATKLGFGEHQHLFNVDRFGNQGAAGAPAVLSMNWDQFKSGEIIVAAVVGSGLTWGAALFKVL